MRHHEPECSVAILDCCPQGQGHSEGWNPQGILSGWYVQNHLSFLNESWYIGVFSWPGESCIFGVLSSRSRSGWNLRTKYYLPWLLNLWTFCNQTWSSDASSRTMFCCNFLLLLSWRSRSWWVLKSLGNISEPTYLAAPGDKTCSCCNYNNIYYLHKKYTNWSHISIPHWHSDVFDCCMWFVLGVQVNCSFNVRLFFMSDWNCGRQVGRTRLRSCISWHWFRFAYAKWSTYSIASSGLDI